jgi:Fic family protein
MTEVDLRKADAAYQPFPPFSEWIGLRIDEERWQRYARQLEDVETNDPAALGRALEIVRRVAAVETGAIEGLYEVDRGFTITIATQAAMWETLLGEKDARTRALIRSQLEVYEELLDLATRSFPIVEAGIRKLHEDLCRDQETYVAHTEIGRQDLALPKGRYKSLPNHVIARGGGPHAYAPVQETPSEMHRLCAELRRDPFLRVHPVLQASYAHYGLVVIHPFADGNGRVARALASVFTYRSHGAPILILAENQEEYLTSLEAADSGDRQGFVDFIFERAVDAVRLAHDSLRAAARPSVTAAATSLRRAFRTRGDYSHNQVDEAALQFVELFAEELERQLRDRPSEVNQVAVERRRDDYDVRHSGFRRPVLRGNRNLVIHFATLPPAEVTVDKRFGVEVPADCGRHDDFAIRDLETGDLYEARASELIPRPTAALRMRVGIWVESILSDAFTRLAEEAGGALRDMGY